MLYRDHVKESLGKISGDRESGERDDETSSGTDACEQDAAAEETAREGY
jgi:hypothetical protein